MSRKREAVFMGIGILAGLALSGSASAAVQQLTARPTTQTFYLEGEKIDLTAYLIGGSNYVRLRDIGKAVDFGVEYHAADNSVHIYPDAPYIEEVTAPAQTAPSPQAVTEASVQASLERPKQTYPTDAVYPTPYRSTSGGPYSRGIHCSGWAPCVPTPPSVACRGGGWTGQAGIRSALATWWNMKAPPPITSW